MKIFIYITALLAAIHAISAQKRQRTSFQCNGDVEFELITGFVYFASDLIIDSKAGELKLENCINSCRTNPKCKSVNFETGLCVLLEESVSEMTEKLSVSQFPVFTLYAQKICAKEGARTCSSPWLLETVPGLKISPEAVTGSLQTKNRDECIVACQTNTQFQCRSASYNKSNGTCTLSALERNMFDRKMLAVDDNSDYYELACGDTAKSMCEFQPKANRILRTVDAVIKNLESAEKCRQSCLSSSIGCHSYDFSSFPEQICRLSHHSAATLSHIQDPYLQVKNSTTYELQSCYQVTVDCKGAEMTARVKTSKIFDGKVYVRSRPNSCVVDVKNSNEFEINLPYNDAKCDVIQDGSSTFMSDIVIQHHDMIVTSSDVGLALHCRYDMKNTTVTNQLQSGLEVKEGINSEYFEETIISSPNVTMKVADLNGDDIFFAQVGDSLALRFQISDLRSPYEIFVRDLVALDGQDNSEIVLIDETGCPTDTSIMQAVQQVGGSGKILHAPFHAFKFPATDLVQFRALVTPCMPKCEPVVCPLWGSGDSGFGQDTNSYGRRKKREVNNNDIMLTQAVRISDNFAFQQSSPEFSPIEEEPVHCTSYIVLISTLGLFILAQIVLLLGCTFVWHKKNQDKHSNLYAQNFPHINTISY